jgi:ribosome-binding protein aMBF1 (putative translation factor)
MRAERSSWADLRAARMAEPGAEEEYAAARLAFELGAAVRSMREGLGWSQGRLADEAGMTQPAVARFEAGGTVPTLVVLERLAKALGVGLSVRFMSTDTAA